MGGPSGTAMEDHAWFVLTLREWLDAQQHEHTPHRAALNAAIDSSDVVEARALLREAPFNAEQRRYLDDLLDRWDRALQGPDS